MKSLKNLLKKDFLTKNQFSKQIDEKTLFFIFRKVISEEFGSIGKEQFSPQYFSKKTIFVKSNSPAWASELWLNQKRIIEKVNEKTGQKTIKAIKIK